MKKKEYIEKIVLGVLTFILIIYISIGLVSLSIFNISDKFLNKANVYEFVSNIDFIKIIKTELGNELNEFELIENELKELGLTDHTINGIIDSENTKKLSSMIITNMFNKITKNSNIEYRVNIEQINELVKQNIDKANFTIDEGQLLSSIEKKVPNLVLNINGLLDKVYNKLVNSDTVQKYQNYVYNFVNILDLVYSDFVLELIIFVIISFMGLLIFIRKSIYKSLKWLGIAFIISTLILFIMMSVITNNINNDNMLINNILTIINNNIIKYFILYFIISVVFVIINFVWYLIKKCKMKEVSYE